MTERELFVQRWSAELPLTMNMIKALPNDKLDYRPHAGCRTARRIVGHLRGQVGDLAELIQASGTVNHRIELPFTDTADAIRQMLRLNEQVDPRLQKMDEATWAHKNTKFNVNGSTAFAYPLGATAWVLLFDCIHHRGQLSSYIRPMGGKHPDLCGPSGDSGSGQ
jgi:uncharacterized damage-inducible protein DinB